MRLLVILLILPGSILLLSGNGYALNLNDPVEKYSLSGCWFAFVKKELNGPINLPNNRMFHSSPSLIKCSHSYGLIDNFNHHHINIPMQNIETDNAGKFIDKVHNYLICRLNSLKIKNKIDSKLHLICNPKLLLDFYLHREVKPVWVTKDGLSNKAEIFINTIVQADHEGLNSETYHQEDISTLLTQIKLGTAKDTDESEKLGELDLLLSDAFFSFGSHLSEGIVDPYSNNLNWHIKKPLKNLTKIFQNMLYDGNLKGFVDALQPRHSGYLRLKTALLKYMKIKKSGCRHEVPAGGTMRKGDHGTRISALRSRLIQSGDLADSTNSDQTYFDDVL
ncbi:MAG: hypothetical protein JRC89_07865, partial [Deltaproteobacteria bacterium]|nr:hypothetical protein [Deltaproteobacteria bacterium]